MATLSATPAPDFNDPLGMLRACHERIMDQCTTIQKLMQHMPMHGCDEQARQAANAVLRYFDTAGMLHHQDEEIDLFPLLKASSNEEADSLSAKLLDDHQQMDALWMQLRQQLLEVASGKADQLERKLVQDFTLSYGKHVMLENTRLLPLARQLLDSDTLKVLGSNMAARRGTPVPA